MNDKILKLAEECGATNNAFLSVVSFAYEELEAFYRAAYNAGVKSAAQVAYGTGDEQMEAQIRALEMK